MDNPPRYTPYPTQISRSRSINPDDVISHATPDSKYTLAVMETIPLEPRVMPVLVQSSYGARQDTRLAMQNRKTLLIVVLIMLLGVFGCLIGAIIETKHANAAPHVEVLRQVLHLHIQLLLTNIHSPPLIPPAMNTSVPVPPTQVPSNSSAASGGTTPVAHCPYPDRSIYSYMGVKPLRFQVRCNTSYPRNSQDLGALVGNPNECIDSCGRYNDALNSSSSGFCLGASWSQVYSPTSPQVLCWIMSEIDPAALPNSTESSAILQF